MARQVRVEYERAMYHVMAREDRREAIVRDDEDRRTLSGRWRSGEKDGDADSHAYAL